MYPALLHRLPTYSDPASQQLCPENGLTINRNGEAGPHFVLLEKRLLSLSTNEAQLAAVKKALESDGRRLYEKTLNGVVSVTKTSSGTLFEPGKNIIHTYKTFC